MQASGNASAASHDAAMDAVRDRMPWLGALKKVTDANPTGLNYDFKSNTSVEDAAAPGPGGLSYTFKSHGRKPQVVADAVNPGGLGYTYSSSPNPATTKPANPGGLAYGKAFI